MRHELTSRHFLSCRSRCAAYAKDMTEKRAPVSIVIPTLNASARLPQCLDALVAASIDGVVREVIVVDGGSTDDTVKVASDFGARIITEAPSRGSQLKAGAAAARGDWLLFLHADTVLGEGWADHVSALIGKRSHDAGVFTLAFDAKGVAPRFVASGAMLRTRLIKSPYGDQGLLISRKAYEVIGGYKDIPLFEDVDIIKRLVRSRGRMAFCIFPVKAVTSAERYERDGYARRVIKNMILLIRYHLGAPPEKLAKDYS